MFRFASTVAIARSSSLGAIHPDLIGSSCFAHPLRRRTVRLWVRFHPRNARRGLATTGCSTKRPRHHFSWVKETIVNKRQPLVGIESLESRIALSVSPGLQGYEGQPGNQGGGGSNGSSGYEGQPGNQSGGGTSQGLQGYEGQPGNQG
jgi:hypothetical protein